MKKILILQFLLLLGHFVWAQDDKINYNGIGVEMVLLDKITLKEVHKVPIGKKPFIVYDKFFKSWTITYTDEDDNKAIISLKFVLELKDGRNKMIDSFGNYYLEINTIENLGILEFLSYKLANGFPNMIVFYGLKSLK